MTDSAENQERHRLVQEILGADRSLYWHIQSGNFDQWLRIDVTMPQLKTLILVYGGGSNSLRMGQIASALGVALSTATGIVDRLVEQGLLERQEDPDDRRSVIVSLTPVGWETMERPHRATLERMEAVLRLLDTDELRNVASALMAVCEAARITALSPATAAGIAAPSTD